jgi:hypothetical protein
MKNFKSLFSVLAIILFILMVATPSFASTQVVSTPNFGPPTDDPGTGGGGDSTYHVWTSYETQIVDAILHTHGSGINSYSCQILVLRDVSRCALHGELSYGALYEGSHTRIN